MYKRINQLLQILLVFMVLSTSLVAQKLSGRLIDAENKDPLIGATIQIINHPIGSTSDATGEFTLENCPALPFQIRISYTGYKEKQVEITQLEEELVIEIEAGVVLETVEVVSEYSKLKQQVSLTVESLGLKQLQSASEASFYDALGNMRETDIMTVSFGVKVINTRGFNSSTPIRSLQLIDGIDNASPGLNFPLGNFMGVAGLDIAGVDLVIGASSAYFGPGAFNGVVNMRTKSPFKFKGLEVELKGGQRDYMEAGLRYADAIKDKKGRDRFGYKLNIAYSRVYDWEANDPSPSISSISDSIGIDNPGGYDAVNRYGDEPNRDNTSLFELYEHPGLGRIYRTGYWERELADYNSYNLKSSIGLHYLFIQNWELITTTHFGLGTTVMQLDNRLGLRDVWAMQNKLELVKPDKFFFRFYTTREDAGDTYDIVSTAYILQQRRKGDATWLTDYRDYWERNINPQVRELPNFPQLGPPPTFFYDFEQAAAVLDQNKDQLQAWHNQARNALDSRFLIPGTEEFQEAFDDITSKKVSEGGTKYVDRSRLYHWHTEYRFQPGFADEIRIGSNFRLYTPYSEGTIFSDTSNTAIETYEYGAYVGIEKWVAQDRLRIDFTTRMDKHQNYDYLFSPALSFQYRLNLLHSLRFSVSSALRNPTLIEQYFYFKVGTAFLLGNISGYSGLITVDSFEDYLDNGLDRNLLVYFDEPAIKPEKALAAEIAYSGFYFDNKLDLKATYYLNRYKDFIGYKIGLEVPFVIGGFPGIPIAYRFAANAKDITFTTGFSLSLRYLLTNTISLDGNYSWNAIFKKSDDPLIPAYNTPEHKFNIGINFDKLHFLGSKNWGFNTNFRWIEGYTFESSPQFSGKIPAQILLNANISNSIPSLNLTFKVSGSNLLDRKQNGLYGGPLVGRFIFGSIYYNFKK